MDDPRPAADPSPHDQAHNPQERWDSGDEKGPRIVVRPGREFVPEGSLGRFVIDPNATVAVVTGLVERRWVTPLLALVAYAPFGWGIGSIYDYLRNRGSDTQLFVALVGIVYFVGLYLFGARLRRLAGYIESTSMERRSFDRADDPAWLAIACQARWSRHPSVALEWGSTPPPFDVPRWTDHLGPSAPRIVSFGVEIPAPSEGVALGEAINTREREAWSKRMVWFIVVIWLVSSPGIAGLLIFTFGFAPVPALLVATALQGAYLGFYAFGRSLAGRMGLESCRVEPGKLTFIGRRGERSYHSKHCVIVIRRFRLGQVFAYVVAPWGQADMIYRGASNSTQVLAQVAARWVLEPPETSERLTEETTRE